MGTHTVIATAIDVAGNASTASATYTVRAWTFAGFYHPVDMGGVVNTVKGGSTVPIRFEAFTGPTDGSDFYFGDCQPAALAAGVAAALMVGTVRSSEALRGVERDRRWGARQQHGVRTGNDEAPRTWSHDAAIRGVASYQIGV